MSDNEGSLDLRLLGVDLEDDEARDLADEMYHHFDWLDLDVEGVAPVLREVDNLDAVERIAVKQNSDETALVIVDGSVRLVVDEASVEGHFDDLALYRDGVSVAFLDTDGVPLEVPRLVRRAIEHGERGVWE